MILDYEHELTTKDGQDVVATAYGTKVYDLKAADKVGIGDPLSLFFKVVDADFDALTSLAIALKGDTDGAGTSEVELLTATYALAALTRALGVRRVGTVSPGAVAGKRYLRVKFTVTGANPTTGAIVAWIAKGNDYAPGNVALTV
jgi:hypothetical protein